MNAPRLSKQTLLVLAQFMAEPVSWHYGYDLSKATDLSAGTLYPILHRLAGAGWLTARWEQAGHDGRPPRHLYQITPTGVEGSKAMARRAAEKGWPVSALGLQGG